MEQRARQEQQQQCGHDRLGEPPQLEHHQIDEQHEQAVQHRRREAERRQLVDAERARREQERPQLAFVPQRDVGLAPDRDLVEVAGAVDDRGAAQPERAEHERDDRDHHEQLDQGEGSP